MQVAEAAGKSCPFHSEATLQYSAKLGILRCTHEPSCDSETLKAAVLASKNGHVEAERDPIEIAERLAIQEELPSTPDPVEEYEKLALAVMKSVDKFPNAKNGASSNDDVADWPAPLEASWKLLPVPPFDPQMLPWVLRDWTCDIADRLQCPLDYVAVGAVVATASVLGRKITIRPKQRDNWTVIPNLWGMIIGAPGVLKSPAFEECLKPLRRLAQLADDKFEEAQVQCEFDSQVSKSLRKQLEKDLEKALREHSDTSALRAQFADLNSQTIPDKRRYIVNDCTVEKLGELLNQNPNGLLHFRDELAGWLATLERQGHENDRAFYLEAWNGNGEYSYDRIGRGTLRIAATCISMLGTIQPSPLQAYLRETFGTRGTGGDGLVQRFQLAVYPDISEKWSNIDRAPNREATQEAFRFFEELDKIRPSDLGAEQESEGLPFLHFVSEAQSFSDQWRANLENKVRSADEHPVMIDHLSKFRSLMPSLALIFHIGDRITRNELGSMVSLRAAEQAAAWTGYLEAHARRIYHSVTAHEEIAASLLATKIETGRVPNPCTVRDIYRKGWTGLTNQEDVQKALELLEDLDWVRSEIVVSPQGGRPRMNYHINPRAVRPAK